MTVEQGGHRPPELVRSLGRWSLAALVLNGIIGSSVFFLPGPLADRLGWMSLAAWAIAAACCGAMIVCFAEVASRFSGAGGAYLFTQAAFGRFVGMQVGWLSYFVRAITAAVQANLFSTYLAEFWPWAGTRIGGIGATTVFIGFLAAINVRSVVSGARVSNGFALVKITPLLLFGALGVIWLASGKAVTTSLPSDPSFGSWLEVLLLLMFAYGGFESAVIPLGEARNPRRDAPVALLVGLALAALVYLLAQLTVLVTLPDPAATNRPLADSARVMLGNGGAAVITLAALVSVYGWLASNLLTVPRLSMAMAERGDFPALFSKVHPVLRTPWISILFFAGLSWALANQAGLLQNLSLAAVSRLFTYGLVCAALPVLRRRDRLGSATVPPPLFRAPMGNALAAISVLVSITLATRMNLREAITLALTTALATTYWFLSRRQSARSKSAEDERG
ncbi:MAG TPA: APC family permease [Gemmatimonadales bacterium]|nr:APC family permease [Gemmatimonadales bacterium]